MTTERIVDRVDSVFDLRIHKALNLPESLSTRGMLTYSKTGNRMTFKVLSEKILTESAVCKDSTDNDILVTKLKSGSFGRG